MTCPVPGHEELSVQGNHGNLIYCLSGIGVGVVIPPVRQKSSGVSGKIFLPRKKSQGGGEGSSKRRVWAQGGVVSGQSDLELGFSGRECVSHAHCGRHLEPGIRPWGCSSKFGTDCSVVQRLKRGFLTPLA